jgi:hypothetical protein
MTRDEVLRLSPEDEHLQMPALLTKAAELYERVGWRYSCSLLCKNGAYASAEAMSDDPSDDGRRYVLCTAWDTLHFNMGSGGCMYKEDECRYAVQDFERFSWSGPTPIHIRDRPFQGAGDKKHAEPGAAPDPAGM